MMKKLGIVVMAGLFSVSVAGLSFADEKTAAPAPAAEKAAPAAKEEKAAPKKMKKKKAAKKVEEAPAAAPAAPAPEKPAKK